ncbi:hypothetical protein B296_00013191 [Ensete ventricosum]|uniref:Uncharacterized protein n=1 Tax=Ensete ventricosum TaxID=4639 RepID=A0A426ZYV9_ENSVE|nr:hypothetical protein B296_00013191 [Ensete ventricosum]
MDANVTPPSQIARSPARRSALSKQIQGNPNPRIEMEIASAHKNDMRNRCDVQSKHDNCSPVFISLRERRIPDKRAQAFLKLDADRMVVMICLRWSILPPPCRSVHICRCNNADAPEVVGAPKCFAFMFGVGLTICGRSM